MKKYILNSASLLLLLLVALFTGCTKDEREINMNLSEVTAFYAPNDNVFVKLEPSTSASLGFEWEQARAEDGALVMYEVAFDEEGGDFSSPIYKIASDGNGVQNRLTLSHGDLNRIANMAGIESLETGKLQWTVMASKGTNVKQATISRTLELERPAGFATIPNEVYITGAGTEAGADVANAMKMKSIAPGVFEIYTQLSPGNLRFVDARAETATSYEILGTALREGEGAESPAATPTVYRLQLDFNNAAVTMMKVEKLEYWFAPRNAVEAQLTYRGEGEFRAENVDIEFRQESWGRDERYKFRMTLKTMDDETVVEDWGSVNADNSRPTASTPAAWYRVFKQPVSQWDFTFKFPDAADMANADLVVYFDPEADYTHEVVIR